jgi:hypothetical protein
MNLGRSWLLAGAAVVLLATGVAGQPPSTSPTLDTPASPSVSLSPSATPFPWPTIPRQRLARGTFPEWPTGKPTASTTDRGIRLDLWLSSTPAAPGDWVQAIVRATNVGDDTAWVSIGDECLQETLTEVSLDLRPATPMGDEQTGAAAAFKEAVVRRYLEDHFRSPRYAYQRRASGPTVRAFAECTLPDPRFLAAPLAPGGTRTERFIWRAVRVMEERRGGRLQPLHPGTVPVTATWAMAGRGVRPTQQRLARRGRPISVTGPLTLTGSGPGTPSIPELVDRALADPAFWTWVERAAEGSEQAAWASIPDTSNAYHAWYGLQADVLERAPNGYLQVVQEAVGVKDPVTDGVTYVQGAGVVFLDPWSGEHLATWFGTAH